MPPFLLWCRQAKGPKGGSSLAASTQLQQNERATMDIRHRAREIASSGQVATMSDLRLQLGMHGFSNGSISAAFKDPSFEREIRGRLASQGRPKAMRSLFIFTALVAIGLIIVTQLGAAR
jgi:hypothetical protein